MRSTVLLFLPFIDDRFRKAVSQVPLFCSLVTHKAAEGKDKWSETKARCNLQSIRIFQRYVTQSQPENANAYFDWPDRDLR